MHLIHNETTLIKNLRKICMREASVLLVIIAFFNVAINIDLKPVISIYESNLLSTRPQLTIYRLDYDSGYQIFAPRRLFCAVTMTDCQLKLNKQK
uniref:Uncharacterized protein n=1 Tax=Glossina palpalis gambiensis TaxID=67801 RepID=A0A1B0AMJ7_9MUSC